MMLQFSTLALAVAVLSGCDAAGSRGATRAAADSARTDSMARARQDSINRTLPGYVVDSILPTDEELRRFRAAVGGDSATGFTGGSPTREALVRRFVKSVAINDTTDLRAMAVHAREFADLYYLDSPYSHPPYRQSPSLAWRMIQDPSSSGLTQMLRRFGGKTIEYVNHRCDPKVAREGRTTRYAGCLVTAREPDGTTVTRRYFGSIVERDGQFKFLSYTNQF
jgi:hypothetical protein